MYNSQYRDLIRVVNYQRDKLSSQQAELTKYDAEIVFWEAKTREQQHQIEFMSQEMARIEAHTRLTEDQVIFNKREPMLINCAFFWLKKKIMFN